MTKINLYVVLTIFLFSFLFYSCEKGGNVDNNGTAVLKVRLSAEANRDGGSSSGQRSSAQQASLTRSSVDGAEADSVQRIVVSFGDGIDIIATLEPDTTPTIYSSSSGAKNSSGSQRASIERTPLTSQVKYAILAYLDGELVGEQEFVHSEEETTSSIILDAGNSYTFVAYSINSASDLPAVTDKQFLSQATINNTDGDLMYFIVEDMYITDGDNNLDVILKHQFSQITTNLSVGTLGGSISAVGPGAITGSRVDGSIKLSDGILSYNSSETDVPVDGFAIGSGGVTSVSATPTILISPSTTSAELNLSSVTVNGVTNVVSLSGLKIDPYKKYNLNLTFNAPCTQAIGGVEFSLSDGESQTFSAPGADYGFVFDLARLDNSFNLTINGQVLVEKRVSGGRYRLQTRPAGVSHWGNVTNGSWINIGTGWTDWITSDLEFQSSDVGVQNIRFADGSRWEDDVPAIWSLLGTAQNPMLRFVISSSGAVTFFGSKTSGGALQPLEVLSSVSDIAKTTYIYISDTQRYQFEPNSGSESSPQTIETRVNPISWNTATANTVVASQFVIGVTNMEGFGSGRVKVDCDN